MGPMRRGPTVLSLSVAITSALCLHPPIISILTFEESLSLVVAADFHLFDLDVLPFVHGDGPHETQVDTEPSVLPGAFQADPHSVRYADPLRVQSSALEAATVTILDF